jgi:large subunit ribosomal protein L20
MPRVRKGAARTQARRKLLREARGYYGTKSRLKQQAKVAIMRALRNKWRHRKLRRRNFRQLWIVRVTAACRMRGFKYSLMINGLAHAGCLLNRKMLSEIAIHDPATFDALVATARKHCTVAHAKAA